MSTLITTPESTRAEINRENAQFSTGPKTAEGKDRVRFNAVKHGCYSATVVLPHEDHARFESIGKALNVRINPTTPEQEQLVHDLQNTHWRLQRTVAIEANLLTVETEQQLARIGELFGTGLTRDERYGLAQAAAYQANERTLGQLNKQEARLRRLLATLEKSLAGPPPVPTPTPTQAKSGFVPSNYEKPLTEMPVFVGPLAEFKRKQWRVQHGLPAKVAK